jgi:hypothetical protein
MVWVELQRGREPMRAAEFLAASGVTAACTMQGARDAKRYVGVGDDDDNEEIGMSCSLGIHGFGTGSSVVAAGFSKRITLGFQKHGQKQQ